LIDVPVTAPTPGLMTTPGYPVTDQLSVHGCPAVTFAGAAVKLVMVGAGPDITVTEAVTEPLSLVAVRV
jgi:hypothetical protein